MIRFLTAAILGCAPMVILAADDLKISQLEQDVRNLQRQVQAQAQQLDELRLKLAQPDPPRSFPAPSTVAAPATLQWVDASRWQQMRTGMSELAVISLLGPPASMRVREGERVLLYAMEIGASGFLGGSVTLRDRVVTDIEKPVLK